MKVTTAMVAGLNTIGWTIELHDDDSGARISLHVETTDAISVRDLVKIEGTGPELRKFVRSLSSGLKKRVKKERKFGTKVTG